MVTTAAPSSRMPRRPSGLGPLWFGLLGAPAAWAVQELASYALASHGCAHAGGSGGAWAAAVSVVAVLVGAAAALVAARSWRDDGGAEAGPAGFMSFAGMLTSGLFLVALIMNLLLTWAGPPCR
jgi:hypothetical protein